MPRTVRLRLLGSFDARWSDGKPLGLSGKKVQALVAYLAVEGDRMHTREELSALLWGETGDERARHNLRQALSKIRRTCDSLIVAKGDALQLDDRLCEADVRDFEELVGQNDLDQLKSAVELYRHDLLEGLVLREPAFDDWLRDARARLRDRVCDALERLASSFTERGSLDEAMDVLRRHLAIDPASEQAHRELMELLARTGRRSDALRQYQKCAEALERELGAEPSLETRAAHERIRATESGAERELVTDSAPSVETPAAIEPPSVAVLPFENLSAEEDRYFTDGITEDIITALSRFKSLLVIARASSFTYRDRDLLVQQIGSELGAQFIVRGSVRRNASRLRLNVQLIDASSGNHLWAQRFDREIEDIFLVQDEITEILVSTLAGRVEAARLARARRMPPERLDAYDFVLRGKDYHHRFTAEDCDLAIAMLERAIERDPDYAVAHAWLACALGQSRNYRPAEKDALLDRSQAAAERARQLDEHESECHRILAQVFILRRDLGRALSHQERALFLNPNDDRSVCAMGTILTLIGRPEEGEAWVRKAMRLNPYHPENFWFHLARALFHADRDDEAFAALGNITRPTLPELVYRVAASARLGDSAARQQALEALRSTDPDFEAEPFVERQPYERDHERTALLDSLRAAGL
jgi:adenylate cyclase